MISDEVNLLVSKAKSRDADAFTTLILSIKEQLYKTIYVIVQNQSSALEVLDEVIYKSYINLNKLSHNEFFKTWIIRIAINESKNYIKKNCTWTNMKKKLTLICLQQMNHMKKKWTLNKL